jgi:hypothetical protein
MFCLQLVIDERWQDHPSLTQEIIACCQDIKVLGRKELKMLLLWRKTLKVCNLFYSLFYKIISQLCFGVSIPMYGLLCIQVFGCLIKALMIIFIDHFCVNM